EESGDGSGEAGSGARAVLRRLRPPGRVLRVRPRLPALQALAAGARARRLPRRPRRRSLLVRDRDVDKVGERLQGVGISDGSSSAAGDASASKPEEVKRLPGGKLKKKEKQEVVIEKIVRNKRKCVTVVKGLELFGVKLSDASKKLGKKFATGASVVKGPTEKEQIDVQGDISYDIVEFITDTWPDVPESAIFFIEDGRKVPAA
ncbi:Translation initiation factor SUI1 family protein, partial [Zea mays]